MMGFFGMGLWMGMWFLFLFVAVLVYKDAENHGRSDGLMWFILLLVPMVNVVAFFAYLIIRDEGNSQVISEVNSTSILDERYARGEIDRNEYIRMKNDLR